MSALGERCLVCHGSKKSRGAGMMFKSCEACSGTGKNIETIKDEPIITQHLPVSILDQSKKRGRPKKFLEPHYE